MQGDVICWTNLHYRSAVFFNCVEIKILDPKKNVAPSLIILYVSKKNQSIFFFLRIHMYSQINIIVLNLKYMVTLFANIRILHGRSIALFLGGGVFFLKLQMYLFNKRFKGFNCNISIIQP